MEHHLWFALLPTGTVQDIFYLIDTPCCYLCLDIGRSQQCLHTLSTTTLQPRNYIFHSPLLMDHASEAQSTSHHLTDKKRTAIQHNGESLRGGGCSILSWLGVKDRQVDWYV